MTWSWKLGRIAGIDLYMHVTFVMFLGWLAVIHWVDGRSLAAVAEGLAFILSLFGCVVLHELGHALTARRYGIKTRDITLLPIGGVARLERMPDQPLQELWVALAGPAVNVVIAALLLVWLQLSGELQPIDDLGLARGGFLERVLGANVMLVAFNLLPAFPMDGGRALRALLATRIEYTRATQLAASIGQGMAVLFGFLGLVANPLLLFIALFVWIGAGQESGMVQMRAALAGIPVRRAMLTSFRTLAPHSTLGEAADLVLAGSQQDFPVVDNGRVVGMLMQADLLSALGRHGRDAPIRNAIQRECESADDAEMLEAVLARLQRSGCRTAPVTQQGFLVGLITMDNVGEFLMIQAAQKKADGKSSTQQSIP
jgi:Zn-dependent protease